MAVLIPALGTCVSRMTTGERRFAERLQERLEDDYVLWYDVAIGPKAFHPDFVISPVPFTRSSRAVVLSPCA